MSIIKNIEEYYLNIHLLLFFLNGHLINNDISETIKLVTMLPVSLVVCETFKMFLHFF